VKGEPSFGGKRPLVQGQLGPSTEVRERQRHDRFLVVGIGVLPAKRVGKPGGKSDLTKLPLQEEGVALRGLHLDPVAAADPEVELDAG